MVACGDNAEDDCLTSEDCAAEERCNLDEGVCAFACADNGDCLEGETCDTAAGDGGGVCVSDGTGGNNGPQCTVDEDCLDDETCEDGTCVVAGDECTTADDCEGDDICVDGACELPATQYTAARIADVSQDIPALCDNTDPGADIFAIELSRTDAQGNSESYYARFINTDNIVTEGNDQDSPAGIIDGDAPDFTGQCPEGFSGNVVALGCGGSMLVAFVNDAEPADIQSIQDGDTITVYEWGAQCQTDVSDDQDEWSVSICEAGSDITSAECAGEIGVGSGTGAADVTVDTSAM
jgi:hypothetical protein